MFSSTSTCHCRYRRVNTEQKTQNKKQVKHLIQHGCGSLFFFNVFLNFSALLLLLLQLALFVLQLCVQAATVTLELQPGRKDTPRCVMCDNLTILSGEV